MAEYKKTNVEVYKNNNPHEVLERVMEYYGEEIPTPSKNICCPFHEEKSGSFNIKNGLFKCFGRCGAEGDAFDYIRLKEDCDFQEALKIARDILGIQEDKKSFSKLDKLNNYIKDNIKEFSGNKDYKYEEHYIYKNENNVPVFLKIKFRSAEGAKTFVMANLVEEETQYKMVSDKEEAKVNTFYNAHLIAKAIKERKIIFLCEGEKDANTLVKLGYIAISCRNSGKLTTEMINSLYGAHIVIVPDMDEAGEGYCASLVDGLYDKVKSLKVIKFHSVKKYGGKDITDYVNVLSEKQNLKRSQIKEKIELMLYKSLDLKNPFELQQDENGIYKNKFEADKETGEQKTQKIYLTNFNISEAVRYTNGDTNKEYIEIHASVKNNGKTLLSQLIRGNTNEIFLDTRSFAQQLGMDLSFYGTAKDLITLKEWIAKYFIADELYEYNRIGIREDVIVNGKVQKCLVTSTGTLLQDGTYNEDVVATTPYANLDLKGRKMLEKDGANKLLEHMFKYTTEVNAINMWGSLVCSMLNPYFKKATLNTHVLHIFGASGKGKSFVLEEIISPVLNMEEPLSFIDTTPHALKLAFDATNLVTLMDEVKPSKAKAGRLDTLSGAVRELTGSTRGLKGRKDQGANQTNYNSTLIMVGEEEISETAVKNRSNIILYTDSTTTKTHQKHGEEVKTAEFRELLKDLGYTLYVEILNNWDSNRINEMRDEVRAKYPVGSEIGLREEGTYIGVIIGLTILEKVLRDATGRKVKIVEPAVSKRLVIDNLLALVTEDGEASKQNYELWLEKVEDLVGTSNDSLRLDVGVHYKKMIQDGEECIAIAFTDVYGITNEACKRIDEKLEGNRTLKKLLVKSKYCLCNKRVSFKTSPINHISKEAVVLKVSELEKLNLHNLIETSREYYDKNTK